MNDKLITGKVAVRSKAHRDYYLYSQRLNLWLLCQCVNNTDDPCISPLLVYRGHKFDYTFWTAKAARIDRLSVTRKELEERIINNLLREVDSSDMGKGRTKLRVKRR